MTTWHIYRMCYHSKAWDLEHTYMSFKFSFLVCFSILNSVLHCHNKRWTWLKLLYRNRVNIFLSDPPSWQIGYLAICLDTFLGGKKNTYLIFSVQDEIIFATAAIAGGIMSITQPPFLWKCLATQEYTNVPATTIRDEALLGYIDGRQFFF